MEIKTLFRTVAIRMNWSRDGHQRADELKKEFAADVYTTNYWHIYRHLDRVVDHLKYFPDDLSARQAILDIPQNSRSLPFDSNLQRILSMRYQRYAVAEMGSSPQSPLRSLEDDVLKDFKVSLYEHLEQNKSGKIITGVDRHYLYDTTRIDQLHRELDREFSEGRLNEGRVQTRSAVCDTILDFLEIDGQELTQIDYNACRITIRDYGTDLQRKALNRLMQPSVNVLDFPLPAMGFKE